MDSVSLRPGDRLGAYRIVMLLGSGGMGEVYLAEDPRLDRRVALKVLSPELARDAASLKRFEREARAASALNHPSIITIHELGEHDGVTFIASELVDGETLRQRIERRLAISETIDLALQIASALSVAHNAAILHRDIKPENVMIRRDGLVKVLDFGLAKLLAPFDAPDARTIERTTTPGMVVGTIHYMSPEQARGGKLDTRSDIFSFGAMLYEMIAGRVPFDGETASHVMVAILEKEAEPLDDPALQRIVAKALRKDPADRYQTIDDLANDLRAVTRSHEITKVMPRTVPRRRAIYSVAAAVVIALIAAGAMLRPWRERGPQPRIPVVVADFDNQTGEKHLDGLSGMLITSLGQSRRLNVMSRSRMFDVLKGLGRAEVARVDETLGRDVSRAENARGLVLASVSRFGANYIVDVKVLDPSTNEYLFTAKEQGRGAESIPKLIDDVSEKLRLGLDEAEQDVRTARTEVRNAATSNLEAYQHFFVGEQYLNELKFQRAHEEFQRAVKLDPQFAMGWYRVADSLWWMTRTHEARSVIARAVALSDRVPRREQLNIRGLEAALHGRFARCTELRREALALAPDDKETLYNLGDCLYHGGQSDEAIGHFRRVLQIDPSFERAHQHLFWALRTAGRHREALAASAAYVERFDSSFAWLMNAQSLLANGRPKEAVAAAHRVRDDGTSVFFIFPGAYVRLQAGDVAGALAEARDARDSPRAHERFAARHIEAIAAMRAGRYREAVRLYDGVIAAAAGLNLGVSLRDAAKAERAWLLALVGDQTRSRALADELRKIPELDDYVLFRVAWIYLETGDVETFAALHEKHFSDHPAARDLVAGYRALQAGDAAAAMRPFRELARRDALWFPLANAALAAGKYEEVRMAALRTEAPVEVGFISAFERALYTARGKYLLGRAEEGLGNRAAAKKHYQTLVELWRNADTDIPELVDAKARLARL